MVYVARDTESTQLHSVVISACSRRRVVQVCVACRALHVAHKLYVACRILLCCMLRVHAATPLARPPALRRRKADRARASRLGRRDQRAAAFAAPQRNSLQRTRAPPHGTGPRCVAAADARSSLPRPDEWRARARACARGTSGGAEGLVCATPQRSPARTHSLNGESVSAAVRAGTFGRVLFTAARGYL